MKKGYLVSPIGVLEIVAEDEFIIEVNVVGDLKQSDDDALIGEAVNQLSAYFGKKLTDFDLPIRLSGDRFARRVLEKIRLIPYGKVITYSTLAALAGSPKAFRSAGTCAGKNRIPIIVPCHRVVAKNGIGGFGLGLSAKRILLSLEGINTFLR